MQYFLAMEVVDGQGSLRNPIQNLVLREVLSFLFGLHDLLSEIAQLALLHNDVHAPVLISEGILKTYNVGMPQLLQQFQLIIDHIPFLINAIHYFYLFDDIITILLSNVFASKDCP